MMAALVRWVLFVVYFATVSFHFYVALRHPDRADQWLGWVSLLIAGTAAPISLIAFAEGDEDSGVVFAVIAAWACYDWWHDNENRKRRKRAREALRRVVDLGGTLGTVPVIES